MSFLDQWRREKVKRQAMRKGADNPGTVVGVAWFTEAEWKKLTDIAPDRADLDDTFQAWEKNAEAMVRMLQDEGITAVPVMVKVADLQVWCAARGRQVDGSARAEYVSDLLRTQLSQP
jgi:hypothetical protein